MGETNVPDRGDAGTDEPPEALAAELRHQHRQNFSPRHLAHLSGMSRSMIFSIDRGEAVPSRGWRDAVR